MTLTQQIHAQLIADGLMKAEPLPTRDQLLGRAKLAAPARRNRGNWEGQFAKAPGDYRVTALVPHCETPKLLKLCVGFLLRQTEPVYVMIVDTGTRDALLGDVLALRGERVEVHQVNCHGTDHPVAAVAYAMDLGLAACRTEFLWCVHSDCFVTRRDFLADLLKTAGAASPCIGYRTMPRAGERRKEKGESHEAATGDTCFVSHTCTLLHMPTLDDLDVTWSMRRLKRQAANAGRSVQLDTEMALNYRLLDRGVRPIILGDETLDEVEIDANRVHLRAATARGLYLAKGRDDSAIVERLKELLAEDGNALEPLGGMSEVGHLAAATQGAKDKKDARDAKDLERESFLSPRSFASLVLSSPPTHQRPERLNLIYHVAPFVASGGRQPPVSIWRANLRQLARRWHIFNGRRVIAIATGDGLEPPEEVERELELRIADCGSRMGSDTQFPRVPNDPALREAASFPQLLAAVAELPFAERKETEATFYAHAKGVATIGDAEGVMYWRNLMYHALLDDPERIKDALTRYAVVGTHRKTRAVVYPDGVTNSAWHFAGSFFWFRTASGGRQPPVCPAAVPGKQGADAPRSPSGWGVEAWPAANFALDESCCLAMPEPTNPYDPATYPPELRFADPDGPGASAALKIELGGGAKSRAGFVNCDRCATADRIVDFDAPDFRLPFDDGVAHHVYTAHCLEHVVELKRVLWEIVRVSAIGGMVEMVAPHWAGNMANCHGHVQTISHEQAEHWGGESDTTARDYWWKGSPKRLRLFATTYSPGGGFAFWRKSLPAATDEEIMRLCNDACHEVRYVFHVVGNS